MSDIILHHYPTSPYSEKVRAVLGYKKLAYQSVTVPVVLPKPDLMPLTGGYRKTPVIQVGADIYCDTLLILDEIERRHPAPSIYQGKSEGAQKALSWWIERTCFGPAASVIFAAIGDQVPQAFREDRAKFSGRDFDPAKLKQAEPMMRATIEAHFAWAAEMLASRPFLLGDAPGMADFAGYHILWFLFRLGPTGGGTVPAALLPWYERIKAFGHGSPTELDAKAALAIAKAVEPAPVPNPAVGGQQVVVMADDTGRDPIQGALLRADADRITIAREDPAVGRVHLHFPRAGFILRPV